MNNREENLIANKPSWSKCLMLMKRQLLLEARLYEDLDLDFDINDAVI
ncbi:MAG: hypothetical protein ACXW1W_15335 [Methylococcaceae bacterium]